LLGALLLVRFADEWFSFFPAGTLEQIRADLGLTYAQAGLILTALSIGGLAGNAFKVTADFVDRRRLAAFGALAYAACLLVFVLAHSLPVLLVAALCWGAASDALASGCEVALVDLYPDNLASALGRVNAYGAVGDLLAPLTLAGAAAVGFSWRGVFLLGGLLMLVYAAWLGSQRFPPPRRPEGEETPLSALLGIARDRRIVLLAVVNGLFGLLDEPFLGFTMAYAERVRGLDPSVAATVVAAIVAGGIVGFATGPTLMRRLPSRVPLVVFAALVAVAVSALLLVPVVSLQLAFGATFGYSGAAFFAQLQATYLSVRTGRAGTTQAVVSTIGLFGAGFPTLVGAVADARGLAAGLALYAAIPVLMLALLIMDALRVRTPRIRQVIAE